MEAEIIRQFVSQKRAKYRELEQEKAGLTQQQEALNREIRELQQVCPHENTREEWEQDVAEMKRCKYCNDCGARC